MARASPHWRDHERGRGWLTGISDDAWTPIHYPHALWDEQAGQLVSDAKITEVPFTAFTSRRKNGHITARLLVRGFLDTDAPAPSARDCGLAGRTICRAGAR